MMKKKIYPKELKTQQLSISQLEKLKVLFTSKSWPIVEDEELSVFERFYKTLLLLDEEQQNFLIDLTYKFDHITLSKYLDYMIEPLRKLREDTGNDTLMFVTCTPKADVGSVKSSATVLYQLKGTTMKQHINLGPKLVVENIQKLPEYNITDNTTIVMVDDFVGTGETALAAVDYIRELLPSLEDNSKLVLFCIVALQEGLSQLASIGVKSYCAVERRKAIAEEMDSGLRPGAKALMEGIENKIKKLKDEFRFGYKGSEALVCLERCPNNTFPVYWLTKGVAPYER